MSEKMMLTMPETAKITGIGLAKLKQIAREYSDFPYKNRSEASCDKRKTS